jgi:aldose sugar dehydrogenase
MPSISPSNLIFYTGGRFPRWKGHLVERRVSLLTQLDTRIRDVRQGPDGYIYVATEMAALRIEPVE